MGKEYFDLWSIGHFIFGFLSTSTILPSEPIISSIIANIFHLISELTEKSQTEDGKILENNKNHLGDILFFFIGSFLGVIYGSQYFIDSKYPRYIILFIILLFYINEIGREIFPYDWFFNPAYRPINL